MPATRLSLYEEAIRLFGDARLEVLTSDVEARYALDDAFSSTVGFCLRAAPWRFATKNVALPGLPGPAIPGFAFIHQHPADLLRTLSLYVLGGPHGEQERPIDAREETDKIFTNLSDGVCGRYISSDYTDPAHSPWPVHFAKAVAAHLAFSVADRLTNSAAASARMVELYGSLMQEATLHDAVPEDPWLRHQLDGTFQEALLYVLKQGYWDFALRTVEFTAAPITEPPATTPIIGYPYSYPHPTDMLRSHAFFVPAGDGREYPIDIKEDGNQWSTTANYFAVRYVSSERGLDPQAWQEPFLASVLGYLQLRDVPAAPQQAGQPNPAVASFRNILMAALAIDGSPENPWYRFQRTGAFLRACFHVAETGRWKFAINTIALEADAWINEGSRLDGTLPANIYGDGSISPSYSAVFAKPADWLRTIWIYRVEPHITPNVNLEGWPDRYEVDYRDELGNWHTNWRTIQVRYVRRAAIESWRWPQSYADAVLAWLEYEEARQNPQATAVATAKQRIYEDAVDKASKSDDMQEFPPYRRVGHLVRGRYSRIHGHGAQDFTRF